MGGLQSLKELPWMLKAMSMLRIIAIIIVSKSSIAMESFLANGATGAVTMASLNMCFASPLIVRATSMSLMMATTTAFRSSAHTNIAVAVDAARQAQYESTTSKFNACSSNKRVSILKEDNYEVQNFVYANIWHEFCHRLIGWMSRTRNTITNPRAINFQSYGCSDIISNTICQTNDGKDLGYQWKSEYVLSAY